MNKLAMIERFCLIGHIVSMAFGLLGLLVILPHPEIVSNLGESGQIIFRFGMAGGGVVYIIFGAIAVSLYAYRTLGTWHWLTFMLPAMVISLSSELLGTSTGFPFGAYGYLNGLGYKIADLVPFTIPMSWFYLGFVCYLIARIGLANKKIFLAIALGALLLTSWDFVLDPAMSQTVAPFWEWKQPGAFFGMPYQNFAGWMGTGALFMTVATFFWSKKPLVNIGRSELTLPLIVYLSNFAFAAIMSIAAGFWIPVGLGVLLGVIPVLWLWWLAPTSPIENVTTSKEQTDLSLAGIK